MPNLFTRPRTIVVALTALALSVLVRPSMAQLPIPVPGQRTTVQRSSIFHFMDLVAWETAHPNRFRPFVAIPAPLTIQGRLTELDPPQVHYEDGSDDTDEDVVPGPDAPLPSESFLGIVDDQTSIPPDTQGAVGPNHVMTILNTQVQMQNKTGTIKYGPVSLSTFCGGGVPSGNVPFDPHLTYDAATGHWIAVIDVGNISNSSNSHLLLCISRTNDPTGQWYHYTITDNTKSTFWDYPALGISNNWITVTVNSFSVQGGKLHSYVGATIMAVNRVAAESAAATVSIYSWSDTSGFTVSPVVTYDAGVNTQFLAQDDSSNGRIRISTITGTVTHPAYTASAGYADGKTVWSGGGNIAPQSGLTDKVNTGDSRILNAVYRNGYIWCAQTIVPPSSPIIPVRTAVQWWQINPSSSAASKTVQVGRIDDPLGKVFRVYPSIAVNKNNDVLIGYSFFSASTHPSAYYGFHKGSSAAGVLNEEVRMKAGEAPYAKYGANDPRNRWGDYSATVVDPSDNLSFWSVQEYAKSPSSTWSTWWVHVPNH